MKMGIMVCIKNISLPLLIVLTNLFLNAFAQSGRTSQTSQVDATPIPQAVSPDEPKVRSKFVADGSSDQFILIFSASYEGTPATVGEEAADRGRHSRLNDFIEQLNTAGAQGYRLLSVVSGWNPKGIVKLDEAQYEYAWFETTGSYFFSKSGFAVKNAELSKRGFRVIKHFHLSTSCELDGNISYDEHGVSTPVRLETCEYKDLFLLEREKGVEQPVQSMLAGSGLGWRAKMGEVLTTQINEKLIEGLYPTLAFSKFEILLQRPARLDETLIDKPEVRVVTAPNWGRGGLEKKIDELARQGYRLAFVNNGIGVMYQNGETTIPVHYIWLNAKKNLDKQLAQLQTSGKVYRMTYPDKHGNENKLIFEQRAVIDGKRREYKVLKFEFQEEEHAAEGKVEIELAPSSKEALKEMNRLVREGYTVRDLFEADKVSVLLER